MAGGEGAEFRNDEDILEQSFGSDSIVWGTCNPLTKAQASQSLYEAVRSKNSEARIMKRGN